MIKRNKLDLKRTEVSKNIKNESKPVVLIWYGSKQIWLTKEYVIGSLLRESAKEHSEYRTRYLYNTYDHILKEMDNIKTIQIYEDGVIRLHLCCSIGEEPKSSIIVAYEEEIEILKERWLN